jgi:branched-chain amino acid transport system permease protein
MELSSLFYIGALIKNFGTVIFFASSIFVVYLAFRDTTKRGIYCFVPPYHLYYTMARLRHPWKNYLTKLLFSGFWMLLLGYILTSDAATYSSISSAFINGLAQGSYYALMAFAIILIFKTTDLVNFAQADMATVSIFFILTLLGEFSGNKLTDGDYFMPYALAILLMLVFSGGFGAITEMIFIKPVQRQHPISQIILTIGLSMMFSNLTGILWDLQEHTLPNIIGGANPNITLFSDVTLSKDGILSILTTLVIMTGIFSLFKYTLIGIALRATAQNQTTSKLMGINTNMVFIISWAVSITLGGLAAQFAFAGQSITIWSIGVLLLKGFAAAVLGGFSNFVGAVIGGFLLGIFDNLLGLLTNLKEALSFLVILLVLIIKPDGLMGSKSSTKKV